MRRPRRWPHWLGGLLIGWCVGIITLLVLAGISVRLPARNGPGTGDSDVRLQLNEQYLNSLIQQRLATTPQVIVGEVKTTGLQVGLAPNAAMVLTPTFDVAGLFQISPSVDNQLGVDNGVLTLQMLGNPRLGDLPIPIDMLPFNLDAQVHQAVDQITNDVLLAELNDDLRTGFGGDAFDITEVQTDGAYLAIKLRRR